MTGIRAIVCGTAHDLPAFEALIERMRHLVETGEPETKRYECFIEPGGNRFLFEETYDDESGLKAHNTHMADAGVISEIGEITTFESVTIIGELNDAELREELARYGTIFLDPRMSVAR